MRSKLFCSVADPYTHTQTYRYTFKCKREDKEKKMKHKNMKAEGKKYLDKKQTKKTTADWQILAL